MILFEKRYPATLDLLVAESTARRLETWTFDDRETRRAVEDALASRGIRARCRSAYKPLVCAFREEIATEGLTCVEVTYPRHPAAPSSRFLLESYPLSALYPGVGFQFTADEVCDELPVYRLWLRYADGRDEHLEVLAPNRWHLDFADEQALSPCGWQIVDGAGGSLTTAYEQLFAEAMTAIREAEWDTPNGGGEPYFEELNIGARLPIADEPLGYADEVLSLREALHEEFYFSLLEVFQRRSGRLLGDRHLQPGQIVPEIRLGNGYEVKVETRAYDRGSMPSRREPLDAVTRPLSSTQIADELMTLGGTPFYATSVAGRRVEGRYVAGRDRGVIISAGQHANETSSPAGTLLAAQALVRRGGAHFTLCPLENPDGYALHRRLMADNPRHMHHAARYTALGDDLEYREAERYETAIRLEAERLSGARLHLNLHGYPAHEWTRPLSGYVPRGFEMWTLPKGFFLILRHAAGWADASRWLIEAVTLALDEVPGLRAFNDRQIALFETHAGDTGFETVNGFPCLVTEDDRHRVPMTLITEYPDETVYGADFQAAVAAQRATVLAAYRAYQRMPERLLAGMPH
ncbi:peptidase M14 [Salinicola corii]|uniref:Peptidase M14 n=1 Tax=Salinicola corii TaxID=2606937 RepID=A0A640WBF2_9GAMM|nr:peptidase M14 [Salinicola corii]KAA0016034.1 peptidase M14 [Salinicola corii]